MRVTPHSARRFTRKSLTFPLIATPPLGDSRPCTRHAEGAKARAQHRPRIVGTPFAAISEPMMTGGQAMSTIEMPYEQLPSAVKDMLTPDQWQEERGGAIDKNESV